MQAAVLPDRLPYGPPPAAFAVVLAVLAIGAPMMLAFNFPPSSTFLNQAAALIGWGSWMTLLTATMRRSALARPTGLVALQAGLGVLLLAALASPLWAHLPWSLSLSGAALIAAAMLAAQVGATAQWEGMGAPVFRALCIGLVVAGVASSVVGIVQVFAPDWPDGEWIARTYVAGRAVGNMRQPNHLSSLLLWSIVAAVWLGEAGKMPLRLSQVLIAMFLFVVVLSASRTGTLSVGLLALWGLLDKRLSRQTRWCLALTPLAYAVFWYATSTWADLGHHVFGGETRFTTKGDISSSRWGIWSNTLALIGMHPWRGVGFGEFNFAWTLTPFPGRPVAFFDHTHNLILQFAVELGLPIAALVLALLGWALVDAARAASVGGAGTPQAQSLIKPAAFAMVFLILVHSLLEYPLWYAYYLLPAVFALGLCLGSHATPPAPDAAARGRTRPLLLAAMFMTVAGMASVVDYARVVAIFAPPAGAGPLRERILIGQHSVLFSHQADYAAATTAEHPSQALPAFLGAPHSLLDARLMQAWAVALNESGDTERARYVAQRLKEFKSEQSEPFFAPCENPASALEPPPFQCSAPTRTFSFEDFR